MRVREARDGARLEPDQVHVIPHDMDVAITDGQLRLVPRPPKRDRTGGIEHTLVLARERELADTYQESNGLYGDRTPKLPLEEIARATCGR
jgi:hypothetical protein